MSLCPCCSNIDYLACCGAYLKGEATPKTPEALMRSRYTAYSRANIDYIKKTMKGKPLVGFNEMEAKRWASSVKWMGLKVIKASQTNEHKGFVEFIATFLEYGKIETIHENSEFKYIDGLWFYVDGNSTAGNA